MPISLSIVVGVAGAPIAIIAARIGRAALLFAQTEGGLERYSPPLAVQLAPPGGLRRASVCRASNLAASDAGRRAGAGVGRLHRLFGGRGSLLLNPELALPQASPASRIRPSRETQNG